MKPAKGSLKVFACKACGFHYETKELAKKCEAYCKKHKSCSLEITKQSLEMKKFS